MGRIFTSFNKFYTIFPGYYWAIFGGIFGILLLLSASILHSITESVSFFTHAVSSLGWGPNGSSELFSIGLPVLGVLFSFYIIYLTRELWVIIDGKNNRKKNYITFLGFIAGAFALLGLILLSLFSDIGQREFYIHLIGTVIFFISSIFFIILYSLSFLLNNQLIPIRIFSSLIVILFYMSLFIAIFSVRNNPIRYELFESGLMMNMTAAEKLEMVKRLAALNKWITFFEWMSVISVCLWFFVLGITDRKRNKKT